MANLHEITEQTKRAVNCVYVVLGREVHREQVGTHPGMQTFGMEIKGVKHHFAWDHLDAQGNHVFLGYEADRSDT